MSKKQKKADKKANSNLDKLAKKQAKRAKKQIIAIRDTKLFNMVDPEFVKMCEAMMYSDIQIYQWQKSRLMKSVYMGSTAAVVGLVLKIAGVDQALMVALGGMGLAVGMYFMSGSSAKNNYEGWKFQRSVAFTRFARLIVPYLYRSVEEGMPMYTVFSNVLERMEDESDKQALRKMMYHHSQRPTDEKPFEEFARRMSPSDFAMIFMQTLFDISQGLNDLEVISALSTQTSRELSETIESISEFKVRKFNMFPTQVTMGGIMPIIMGVSVAIAIDTISNLDISF
jgi:hypothetical protein